MHEVAALTLAPKLFADCHVVLFEDDFVDRDLFPLTVLRPAWEVLCGAGCLRLWVTRLAAKECLLAVRPRPEFDAWCTKSGQNSPLATRDDREVLFLNGRVMGVWTENGTADLPSSAVSPRGYVIWARVNSPTASEILSAKGTSVGQALVEHTGSGKLPSGTEVVYADHVWDYMRQNPTVIARQLPVSSATHESWLGAPQVRDMPAGVHLTSPQNGHPVFVGGSARLMPGVVINNDAGALWIGEHAEIEPHTYLSGPLLIGPHCRVKAGARLYPGSTFGMHSRVGGEISQSIVQGFTNKQHDGFLGNSHLGSWVNLGADTRTSNLRNDYGIVKVQMGGEQVNSGERFIGLMCGDHTKTGINTMFNTATVVGIGANVFGAGYPPQYIPSFCRGGKESLKVGRLESTLEIAKIAMSRRGVELSTEEAELIRRHYEVITSKGRSS